MDKHILNFWFKKKPDFKKWFQSGKKYDKYIKNNFIDVLKLAEKGNLFHWIYNKNSFIALIILLDQFSRHIYRGTKYAYKNDILVINILYLCLDKYIDKLDVFEKIFIVVPFQHSENINDQYYGIKLLHNFIYNEKNDYHKSILKNILYHQKKHCKVIEIFGRFPKRNKFYNIKSSFKETEYIKNNKKYDY